MDNNFALKKQDLTNKLVHSTKKIQEFEGKFELDLHELKIKLQNANKNLQNEKFKIAFFGAFSDGKSSLISILTKRLDIEIAPEPTTDKISTYTYGDYFIIDTPGLFSENIMHDEITKKYISEADLIIYTLESVNPLKESHSSVIRWLLGELSKAKSTLFVVNRMDDVADLYDDDDFSRVSDIKVATVTKTLQRYVPEIDKPNIVCVSTDPFGKGLKYWLNSTEYETLSRIRDLQNLIRQFIETSGKELLIRAGISVILDTTNVVILQISSIKDDLINQGKVLDNQRSEQEKSLSKISKDINKAYVNINEEVIEFRKEVLNILSGCPDIAKLRESVNIEIGDEGEILKRKIDIIIENHTQSLYDAQENSVRKMEESLKYHLDLTDKLLDLAGKAGAKGGAKILKQSRESLAKGVKSARDIITRVTGKKIKFKPWGTFKWADRIKLFGKFLKAMPIITETIGVVYKIYSEAKFNKEKDKITNEIKGVFKDFIDDFTKKNFTEQYFPHIAETRELLKNIESSISQNKDVSESLEKAVSELKELQATYD